MSSDLCLSAPMMEKSDDPDHNGSLFSLDNNNNASSAVPRSFLVSTKEYHAIFCISSASSNWIYFNSTCICTPHDVFKVSLAKLCLEQLDVVQHALFCILLLTQCNFWKEALLLKMGENGKGNSAFLKCRILRTLLRLTSASMITTMQSILCTFVN